MILMFYLGWVTKPEWISNIDESPYHVIQEVNPANKEEYKILKFNGAKIKKDFELVTRVKRLEDDEHGGEEVSGRCVG